MNNTCVIDLNKGKFSSFNDVATTKGCVTKHLNIENIGLLMRKLQQNVFSSDTYKITLTFRKIDLPVLNIHVQVSHLRWVCPLIILTVLCKYVVKSVFN